jgi:hypothetical protein
VRVVRGETASSEQPIWSQIGSLVAVLSAPLRSTATIVSVFLVSLAFVLALVTLLDYFKFQSAITGLAEQRVGIIIARVHKSLETAIDLGLNLRAIGIERIVAASTEAEGARIKNSYVFAADGGAIIYSSDPAAVATKAAPAWLAAQAAAGDAEWRVRLGDHLLVGERLDSALAAAVGGVVLDYSLADVNGRVAAMRDHLIGSALVTFLAFAILAVGGAIVATREFRRTIGGLTEAISFAAEPPPPVSPSINDPLRSSLDQFRRTTSEAHDQLDRVEVALALALARRSDPAPPAKAVG